MRVAIVTGVSKGLGATLASLLLESNMDVYGVSRTPNKELAKVAQENNCAYHQVLCDLGNQGQTDITIDRIIAELTEISQDISELYIINNAAVVQPIKRATEVGHAELSFHYQVNVVTPMVILNRFLEFCTNEQIMLTGVNITSGAAERPIYGWSAYGSSKASLNMYTESVALEQAELDTGHKVIAFSPGVMDTEMQAEIRSSNYDQFIDVDTFKGYKKQNILTDTMAVASVLVDIIIDESVQNGKIYDVRDYF